MSAASPSPKHNRHERRRTIAGAVITLSLPAGVYLGYKTSAEHGILIGCGIGLLIPFAAILFTGTMLVILRPRP